jgi:hypothetical protein
VSRRLHKFPSLAYPRHSTQNWAGAAATLRRERERETERGGDRKGETERGRERGHGHGRDGGAFCGRFLFLVIHGGGIGWESHLG